MGWIRDTKTKIGTDHTTRSWEEEHSVFLYSLNLPVSMATVSGPVPDAAEVIEGI